MIIEVVVDIDASPERVWSVMADVERWPEWTASINSIRFVENQPLQVGSKLRIRQPNLPPAVWQVTRLDPGRGFVWVAKGPGLSSVATHAIESLDGSRSRVTLRIEQRGFISTVITPLIEGRSREYVNTEAQSLKRRSEADNL